MTKINTQTNNVTIDNDTQITRSEDAHIIVPVNQITALIEILDHCEEFLRTSSRAVRSELADYCLAQPTVTSGWLIDMVGFTALRLRTNLEEAGHPKPPLPSRTQTPTGGHR